jgi:hypothetical protein
VKVESNLGIGVLNSEFRSYELLFNYIREFVGVEVNVESGIFNQVNLGGMAALFNKNIGRKASQIRTNVMEYFFSNHFSTTLVNTHQIKYINVIGSGHNEVVLVSCNEKDMKKISRRLNRIGST